MTAIIIISLILVVAIAFVCAVGVVVARQLAAAIGLLREQVWQQEAKINELATVVAKNAARTTRLEGEDSPRRPVSPATYIMDTYPKRWDEVLGWVLPTKATP